MLQTLIDQHGPLIAEPITNALGETVGTRYVANPAVRMLRDAEKQLNRELNALGFDPTSRSRLGLAEVKTANLITEFYEKREKCGDERHENDSNVFDIEILPDS